MFFDFVEIGTAYFDTEVQNANDDIIGLSVEPIKQYLDKLPNPKKCIKENAAISDKNGQITCHYVPLENIEKYNLPWWIGGCNSINHNHPTVVNVLKHKGLSFDLVKIDTVPVMTIQDLFKKHNVDGIYLLKTDTEGHDCVILNYYFDTLKSNDQLAHKIIFEANELTPHDTIMKFAERAKKYGYQFTKKDNEINATLTLQINNLPNRSKFKEIKNYYLDSYPLNYDLNNLPHENTFEDAKKYCIENNHCGITFENGKYIVCQGKLNYRKDSSCWIYI